MATVQARAIRWRNDRLFYTGMGVAIGLLTLAGFARSYYLAPFFDTPRGTPEITPLLHVHGAVFTGWIMLIIVQPALIAANNRPLHRKLGYAGAILAILMVVLGNLAAIAAMRVGFIGLGDPRVFYAIPFFAINGFAVIVAFAVAWRHRAEAHKRLMLLASTQIVEAAVARVPVAMVGANAPVSFMLGADFIIVAGILYDLVSRGRVHPVWIWGGGLVVASQWLRLAVATTQPWLDFAAFMGGLW